MDPEIGEPVRPTTPFIGSKGLRADDPGEGRADGQASSGEEVLCERCEPEEPEDEMEARTPNIAKQPYSPTKAEIDSHFPFACRVSQLV